MLDKIKRILTILDLPSGVIMGLYTLVIIGLSVAAFVMKRVIDSTILTAYGMVAGLFAIHKTSTAITTITSQGDATSDKTTIQ